MSDRTAAASKTLPAGGCASLLIVASFAWTTMASAQAERAGEAEEAPNVSTDASPPSDGFFVGVTGLVGASFFVGPNNFAAGSTESPVGSAGMGAVRLGGLLDGLHEVGLEVSPFAYSYSHGAEGPAFQVNVTYAVLLPLHRSGSLRVAWPLLAGAGVIAGNTYGAVLGQLRVDLIGLQIQVDRWLIDLHLPSFRWAVAPSDGDRPYDMHIVSWFGGGGVSYVF